MLGGSMCVSDCVSRVCVHLVCAQVITASRDRSVKVCTSQPETKYTYVYTLLLFFFALHGWLGLCQVSPSLCWVGFKLFFYNYNKGNFETQWTSEKIFACGADF